MAEGGPDAISLRAIAREMGMTAGAIYGYFPTRDDLITTLIRDVHTSLVDALEAGRDTVPRDDPAGRILAWALAFREWALANPQGFRLIYGDPVPGYQIPEGGAAPEAEHRTCMGLTGLVAGAWPQTERIRPTERLRLDRLRRSPGRQGPRGVPRPAARRDRGGAAMWGRLHGLLSLEIYGHLRSQVRHPARMVILTNRSTSPAAEDEKSNLTRDLKVHPAAL